MSLDDGCDESFFLCLRRFFSLSCFYFFDNESGGDGYGSGSSGTCSFPFSSENSVGRVSGSKSVGRVSGLFSVGRVSGIFSLSRVTKSVGRVSGLFSLSQFSGIV